MAPYPQQSLSELFKGSTESPQPAPPALGIPLDPGIVARCNSSGAQRPRAVEEMAELEAPVAGHAGDGCASREVFIGERFHHLAAELARVVCDVEADPEFLGHPPRVVRIIEGAAARGVARKVHGHADHLAPPLHKERSGDRRVDAP